MAMTDQEIKQLIADAMKTTLQDVGINPEEIKAQRQKTIENKRLEMGEEQPDAPPVKGDGGFKSFGHFLQAVKYRPNDERLKMIRYEKSGMSEGSDAAGGFLVPEQFKAELLAIELETAVWRATGPMVIPMATDKLSIPKINDTAHSSSVFGGIVAYWTEEAGTVTVKEPGFGRVNLMPKKLTGYTYVTNELLTDSPISMDALIKRMFGEAIGWYEDDAFIDGDGVGKPLGILKSGSLLSINRSAASACALADLANMYGRLMPQSHKRAVWLANPTILTKLIQLASTTLIFMPMATGVVGAPPAQLLGRPIYFTEKCSALGTAGDIILCDPKYYLIGDRTDLTVATSEHTRFTTDETAWRFTKRVDGQPWVDSAFTPANGSTLSPFVTLHSTTNGGD